jgi:hypothetical protein
MAALGAWCGVLFAQPRTMRVDYYHTGSATEERFSLDRVVVEPLSWAGNPDKPIDATNLGKYFFEVVDQASGRTLYSRGFSSVYGEWETTAEAKRMSRTFSESFRFPRVDAPVRIVLKKRDDANAFRDVWTLVVDPGDKFVERGAAPALTGPLITLRQNGSPSDKLDLLILGDGYTEAERPKFELDARRLVDVLLSTVPFSVHAPDINVWALCPASPESGVSHPSQHLFRRTALGATYDAFDSERYILAFDNRTFRDIAASAPYDVVEILVNDQTYGGGGIFGLYSTVAADSAWAPYVFVHEFGHHLAALADEYYTSDVAYLPSTTRVEPWEPNVTALLDPQKLKWRDLVAPGTPLPTPWPKAEFEANSVAGQARRREIREANRPESEMDALFRQERARTTALLQSSAYAGKVGAFEGANYEAQGYFRPQTDCIMFTRDEVPFCEVCRRAIEKILDMYARH